MGLLKSNPKILIDSSAWISIALSGDDAHEKSAGIYFDLQARNESFYTIDGVISETLTRLRYSAGFHYTKQFYETIELAVNKKELKLLWSTPSLFGEAWKIMSKYHDHRLSFVDCLIAATAHRKNIKRIFTLDGDFLILGFTIV